MTKPKVLVVDDDPMVLRYLATGLASYFDVVTTDDPASVPAIVRHEHPDAVLCDIRMPGTTGPELAATLQRECPLEQAPVIYLTSLVEQDPLQKYGGRIGGRPAISKGADLVDIIRMVQQVCQPAVT